MEICENNIRLLLQSKPFDKQDDFCDFSLKDQNDLCLAKGIEPIGSSEYKPVVQKTVTYIVVAVIFNECGQTLMIQEAKSSCAGKWYLPAGRIEPGEDIHEAVRREVKEETGFEFQPISLLLIECSASGCWYRFVLTGSLIGGRLKLPADADSESLQANWVTDIGNLNLRSNDVIPLIDRARLYQNRHKSEAIWHSPQLPVIRSHKKLLLRLVVIIKRKANNRVNVLVSEKTCAHLPVCEISPVRSLLATLKKYMTEIFGSDLPPHRPEGLLSVEHSGHPTNCNDGLCLTLLIGVRDALENVCLIDKYAWMEVDVELGQTLLSRMGKTQTIQLHR